MQRLIWILILSTFSLSAYSQLVETKFSVYNNDTKLPVDDAHVFFNNTSFGAISNTNGSLILSFPNGLTEDLIISHISYDTKIISSASFSRLSKIDSIFLVPNGIKIDEIVVTQKRSKSWKNNLNRFKKAFLGDDKIASKCKIHNPEVLRFNTKDDHFIATAVDLIKITNKHLGYDIKFLLTQLSIDKNGSMKYLGHANFKDISNPKNQKKIEKNRITAYKKSPSHFFKHLVNNELDKGKYEIKLVQYTNGVFEEIMKPATKDILYFDSTSNKYLLSFDGFLEVKHLGFKEFQDVKIGVRQGGLESSRFNTQETGTSARPSHPTSWLYKITPMLIINPNGNIVNHRAVQEYGYWANQRMAHSLPLDYGLDYSEYHEFDLKKQENKTSSSLQTENSIELKQKEITSLSLIKDLLYRDEPIRENSLKYLNNNWENKYVPPLLDLLRITQNRQIKDMISVLLKNKIGSANYYEGLQWLWENDPVYDSLYADTKAELYSHVDPKFKTYFENRHNAAVIGLDEIVWGGVKQDGIPPLRNPKMLNPNDATYLFDEDIVFGISINGDHRAYPKRILAWHELFVDEIANTKIAGVYCTLCGTMIAYGMVHNQKYYDLGTSGFLYRSNKLMYDKESQSLWSTIDGTPVLGPLTDQEIKLESYPTVTTTWGEWKKRHPSTKVLSIDTGHKRDYGPGVAYSAYFSTDKLMFPVPKIDKRLRNKDEVLVIRAKNYENNPIAISISYLKKHKIYMDKIADQQFIVISEKDGWVRAYETKNINFKSYKKGKLNDENGEEWKVNEQFILGPNNAKFARIPTHNSFWFAWYNAHPNTRLIH
jgi:hypothetical protein